MLVTNEMYKQTGIFFFFFFFPPPPLFPPEVLCSRCYVLLKGSLCVCVRASSSAVLSCGVNFIH